MEDSSTIAGAVVVFTIISIGFPTLMMVGVVKQGSLESLKRVQPRKNNPSVERLSIILQPVLHGLRKEWNLFSLVLFVKIFAYSALLALLQDHPFAQVGCMLCRRSNL
jgi:hypothetical protein